MGPTITQVGKLRHRGANLRPKATPHAPGSSVLSHLPLPWRQGPGRVAHRRGGGVWGQEGRPPEGWAVLGLQETFGVRPTSHSEEGDRHRTPWGLRRGDESIAPAPIHSATPAWAASAQGPTFFHLARRPCRAHGPSLASPAPSGQSVRSWSPPARRWEDRKGHWQPRGPGPISSFLLPSLGAEIWLLLSEAGLALETVSSQCVHSCWGPASSHPGPWPTQSPWGCPYSPCGSTLFSHSGPWAQGLAVSPPCCVRACPSPTSTGHMAPSAFQTP